MDTTPLTPFRINMGDALHGTVEVDGRDVSDHVAGLAFDAGHGNISRLTLHLRPTAGAIEGVAIVDQIVQEVGAVGDQVRRLDPEQVRQLVAERNLTLTDDPYAAMLEIVADLLDQTAEAPDA